jgi:fatty acid-binding protein DegV
VSLIVCTDSSALIAPAEAERLGIAVLPVQLSLDGEPLDERTVDVDDFYERLDRRSVAKTSQPSPGAFAATYERLAECGASEILSVHMSRRVSGTVAAAELAARSTTIPVTVLDTGTVSFGVAVCARAAAEAAAAGGTAGETAAAVRRLAPRVHNVFVAVGAPAGRLAPQSGWSVLEFSGDAAITLSANVDAPSALAAMIARVASASGAVQAAVGHAGRAVEPAADALAVALEREDHVVGVERYRVGPAVGAHTGPLTFGAFWWPPQP